MLKNENMNIKNTKIKIPLIERIVICGIQKKQLNEIKTILLNNDELLLEFLSNLNMVILEEYISSLIKSNDDNSYIKNIPKYSIPLGLNPKIIKNKLNTKYESDKKIISFSLVQDTKLKHCTSLSFYDIYKLSNNKEILLKKSITLISSKEYYNIHKTFLEYIYNIIINFYSYKNNKNSNLLKKICYENYFSHEKILFNEYFLIPFYFSFILNSFDVNPSNNKLIKSFHIIPLKSENDINDFFIQLYIDDKIPFPIKDYDISILLSKFHIEDLIILYQSLLMEYEIILIFNNFEEINIIIYSLLSLIYPLKWNFPITSFLLPETEVMLDAPFATIIGVHESYKYLIEYKIKKDCFNLETTIIYDLIDKKFVLKDPGFPMLNQKMENNIKSFLFFVKSEIYQFKLGIIQINNGLMKLFERNGKLVNKINYKIYLNMKIISIFFNVFIDLIKDFKSCIKYEYIEKNKININTSEPNDFFDFNKYEGQYSNKNIFFLNFAKTLMFSNFIRSFIKNQNTKKKYIFINDIITKLSKKELINQQKYLNTLYDKSIRSNLSNYYLIKYMNLNISLNNYFMKGVSYNDININMNDINKLNNNELLISFDKKNIKNFSDNMLNSYYANMFDNSKVYESFVDSIILIGIKNSSSNNNINEIINKKMKENEEIYDIIKEFLEEKKNKNIINLRNTGHHRSSSSMNEKIFQQQKLDINLNLNINNQNNNNKNEQNGHISSVNTFSKNNSNNLNNDKKVNKPLRTNYNSLTNVVQGAMAKHAGDKDDIINIPDDI